MGYNLYLRREAMDFLRKSRPHGEELLSMLDMLAKDPFKRGNFTEPFDGREIQGWIWRKFSALYWTDHFSKEVKVIDLRWADA
jgi:hypothetical protein